jgi:hypothetical protein
MYDSDADQLVSFEAIGEDTGTGQVPVVDLGGRPLTPCSREKAEQNLRDGLATMDAAGVLHLNYRPLAHRRIYRQIQRRDGWVCAWCHGPGSTLDHVIPVCWGGQTTPNNCVIACRACNHSRNNALPTTFLRWTGFRPSHPVIRDVVAHEQEYLRRAEEALGARPLSSCVSREEAQVWVAFHVGQIDRVRPLPPEQPITHVRPEGRAFNQYFVP